MHKLFISTIPFASISNKPLRILEEHKIDYEINPFGRKITENELLDKVHDVDGIIAGTEPITKKVLQNAKNLKVISRVGIGLDNIDIEYAKEKNIKIETSASGLTRSVAEFTLGLILISLRNIHTSNSEMKRGNWGKRMGKSISECTVGIIGAGNIGSKVIDLISAFDPKEILYYDPYIDKGNEIKAGKVSFERIIEEADVLSLHAPLNNETKGLISRNVLSRMKQEAVIINTSRGGIIIEDDLFESLSKNEISCCALDVFEEEPYRGKLIELDNCLVTPHIAPMTSSSRKAMEIEAVNNVIKVLHH